MACTEQAACAIHGLFGHHNEQALVHGAGSDLLGELVLGVIVGTRHKIDCALLNADVEGIALIDVLAVQLETKWSSSGELDVLSVVNASFAGFYVEGGAQSGEETGQIGCGDKPRHSF